MNKKVLSSIIALSSMLVASAATDEFEFTYTDPEAPVSALGNKTAESIDVAILIDNPAFAGMKIKKITAFTNTVSGISNTSVWLSSRLALKDGRNVADILEQPCSPVASMFYGEEVGAIEYTFENPYELSREPIYIGYSMTVDNAFDMATNYPVIISKVEKKNDLFIHTTKQITQWQDYSASGAAAIIVTIEKEDYEYNLGITGTTPAYSAPGENFFADVTVCNIGDNPISSISYSYTFDDSGNLPVVASYQLPQPINPDVYSFYTLTLPFNSLEEVGQHEVYLSITEINGQPNPSADAVVSFSLDVLPFIPVHRPLIEEYTGLWCGYCPRGYIAMELIAEEYGDNQVSICFHNDDGMTVTNTYPMNVTSFPNASVDRRAIIDPYYGSSLTEMGIRDDIEAAIKETSYASIDVKATLEGDVVNIESSVLFNKNFDTSPYLVGYVLTCNGLSNARWIQQNYFHNNNSLKGTPLEPLIAWPSAVTGLVFNDVAVAVDGMSGVAGSLPSGIEALKNYTHQFTYNISGNSLVQDPANLVVNAFVVNKATGRVINANKCNVANAAAVDSLTVSGEVEKVEYFDLSGIRHAQPGKGIYIRVTTFNDGTVKTDKIKK